MNLWTWQRKGLRIDDPKVIINSRKYSYYLNDRHCDSSELNRRKKAYQYLWEILETDQILWCFTEETEALNASKNPWCKDCDLWKLDVPEKNMKFFCEIAWHWILSGRECAPPEKFRLNWKRLETKHRKDKTREFSQEKFDNYWRSKSEEELWSKLFLPHFIEECAGAIIFPPLTDVPTISTFQPKIGFALAN